MTLTAFEQTSEWRRERDSNSRSQFPGNNSPAALADRPVTQANWVNKSALWTSYNAARRLVRLGQLDAGRTNRGLGIAQSSNYISEYTTSATSCTCPDSLYRPNEICKHRVAFMLLAIAREEASI